MFALSKEVRRLESRWRSGAGWPQRLEWFSIDGLRGWSGQTFEMRFPIMAVVGENGVGKTTVIQCAASVYKSSRKDKKKGRFASDFFPDTPWERVEGATIRYSIRQGVGTAPLPALSVRKPTSRWNGNVERKERAVEYIDLSRVQPVSARTGYQKLAKTVFKEVEKTDFDTERLSRLSAIMGRQYESARMSITDGDSRRAVPVLVQAGNTVSGFHQGAGETTIAELLQADLPRYGLILIDEIETSLHPRMQRRLIRDLAERCRERELQVILTTHSPYILEELPLDARACIMQSITGVRKLVYGVSPEFAMSRMDELPHHECDLYVEDIRAGSMLREVLAIHSPDLVQRCMILPCGGAEVGRTLGQMAYYKRFPRPTCVFLDADQPETQGCILLPGDDAPERVAFEQLRAGNWFSLADRVARTFPALADACARAMLLSDHHEWVEAAAIPLALSADFLWDAMCSEWAAKCVTETAALKITVPISDVLREGPIVIPSAFPPSGSLPLFSQ